MNFTKDLEMPEESRKRVNAALSKQREKIAMLEMGIEHAFNAGFSLGFGSDSMEQREGQFEEFKAEFLKESE